MNFVLAVRDRNTGAAQTARELGGELKRRGHRVYTDEGDFHQSWDGADAALCHADDLPHLTRLSRLYRVPLVLLGRNREEVAAVDPFAFRILATPSRAAFGAWHGSHFVVPPLVPLPVWRVCPHHDPGCPCPWSAVCRYEDDPQTEYRAPAPPAAPWSVTLVGGSIRHGVSVFYEIARRQPDREFVVVQIGVSDVPPPVLRNLIAVGPLDVAGMRRVYAHTRLLLMPGPQTAGRPALEAACSGIPTIAHPSPGAKETLGSAVHWASAERIMDWLHRIHALDEPAVYRAASAAAFAHAQERVRTTTAAVDRLEAALRSLTPA